MGFCPNPKHFIVHFEQTIIKYAEKWGGGGGAFGWKLCWSSLCNSIWVAMQSARQWQELILYLLELQ